MTKEEIQKAKEETIRRIQAMDSEYIKTEGGDHFNEDASGNLTCERIIGVNPQSLSAILCNKKLAVAFKDAHKLKHEKEPLLCSICNKEIIDYYSYMRHVHLHDGSKLPRANEYVYQCNYDEKEKDKKI